MGRFERTLGAFSLLMGTYGFTRGYRSQIEPSKKVLTMERIGYGLFNGILYSMPVLNILYFSRLMNRIEIEYYGLDKKRYISEYKEVIGECMDTF